MARILILQDEPPWNNALIWCLKEHHSLSVTDTVDSALTMLRNEIFEAVIVRIHLGGDDNVFEFLKELKNDQRLCCIPVICFCGRRGRVANIANSAVDTVATTLGARAYLSLQDFCVLDRCDFDSLRKAIESAFAFVRNPE